MAERTLISIEKLPDRSSWAPAERIAAISADTEEAMNILRRRLEDRASRLHVTGWSGDTDDIKYDLNPGHTAIVARFTLSRLD